MLRSTRGRARAAPFASRRHGCRSGFEFDTHRCEEGQRQYGQGDVPVPAVPGPDLVIRQADLLLGDLEALLDGLATRARVARLVSAGPKTT